MPRILYIGQAPNLGTGSPVILLRHLRRLAQSGWQVSVLPEWGDDVSQCRAQGWELRELVRRESWWPPLPIRHEPCRRIAVQLWARWLRRNLQPRPDAILCYLAWHSDLFCEIAAAYGRLAGIPVTCLVHDDAVDFETNRGRVGLLRRRQARILRHNHQNWFVSPEQADNMAPAGASKGVLPPIPEGLALPDPVGQATQAQAPRIYYAGYLWPAQARLLAKLAPVIQKAGARLVVLGRKTPEVEALLAGGDVDHLPLFPSNTEALAHLKACAAGLLVSYTEEISELAWTRTSMPSKLIEYSYLGLPMLLVAPEQTSVMLWARQKGIQSAITPGNHQGLETWVRALGEAGGRRALCEEWTRLTHSDWDPAQIQQRLERALL